MFEGMDGMSYGGGGGGGGAGAAALSREPKQRLRWTPELHDRFVHAVARLGGPDSESSSFAPSFPCSSRHRATLVITHRQLTLLPY